MFHRDKMIVYIFCMLFFIACGKKEKSFNVEKISSIRKSCIEKTKGLIGKDEYYNIYDSMNDTVSNWIDNKIEDYQYWRSLINYQIDSVICINNDGDKIITSILLPYIGKEGVQDDIILFYGVKIDRKWYFFQGPALVLPRESYQKDIHTPLSFEKLKQIATLHIYDGYLKRNAQGKWEINEDFFSDLTSCAWSEKWKTNTQTEWDSIYLEIIAKQWADHRKEIFKEREKEKQRKTIELSHRLLDSIRANKKE